LTPIQVNGLTGITSIAVGEGHSLFLKNNGTAWACGFNNAGQIGDGSFMANKLTPVQITGLCQSTVVNEITEPSVASVYPNPSGGIFQITNNELQIRNLEIYNLFGEKIYSSRTTNGVNPKIDISKHPKGIYLMKIQEGANNYTKKIVVQ